MPTHRRPLGYVFQEASLFPHLSVRKNLLFGAPRDGEAKGAIDFDEVVDLLGVKALLDRSPRNLSGGERQRVGIGRALLSQPKLLLMDEPLSALDRVTKSEILPFLERLRDRLSLPIIYITHDFAEVERLADHVVLMRKGRVIGAGPLAELQSDPSLPLAAAQDAAVSLDGIVESYDARYGLLDARRSRRPLHGARAASADRRTSPHQYRRRGRLALARAAGAKLHPQCAARTDRFGGSRSTQANSLVVLALGREGEGGRILARVTRKSWDQLGLAEGESVHAQVKAVALARGAKRRADALPHPSVGAVLERDRAPLPDVDVHGFLRIDARDEHRERARDAAMRGDENVAGLFGQPLAQPRREHRIALAARRDEIPFVRVARSSASGSRA